MRTRCHNFRYMHQNNAKPGLWDKQVNWGISDMFLFIRELNFCLKMDIHKPHTGPQAALGVTQSQKRRHTTQTHIWRWTGRCMWLLDTFPAGIMC